jgi:hypothetical protein
MKDSIPNNFITCTLSSLLSFICLIHFSLSCMPGQSSSILICITSKYLVCPLYCFKFCFFSLSYFDSVFDSMLFAFGLIEFICSFIFCRFKSLVLIFRIQPTTRYCNLLFESSCRWHSLISSFIHCSKIRILQAWLEVLNLRWVSLLLKIDIGNTSLMCPFSSNVHF